MGNQPRVDAELLRAAPMLVGIAAQASLSNIIASVVILFARPYTVGMYVAVRGNAFSGAEFSGQVREVGLFYTTPQRSGKVVCRVAHRVRQ